MEEAWAVRAAVVERPACLQRPLARPGFAAGRSPFRTWRSRHRANACKVSPVVLVGTGRRRGSVAPGSQSTKYPEAQPPGRRKHPLSSQENFTGQFRKPPHLLPFPPPADNGALYFLPSQQQPPPLRAVGPERAGNAGHTAGTQWVDLCLQAQREGSCARVTGGVGLSIPQPCPTHGGESDRGSHFPDGDTEAPGVGRRSHISLSSRMRTPSQDSRGLRRGTQETKGQGLLHL